MTYNKIIKRSALLGLSTILFLSATACSKTTTTTTTSSSEANYADLEIDLNGPYLYSDEFTTRDLDASYDKAEVTAYISLADNATTITKCAAGTPATAISINGNIITITAEGIYVLSGNLSNGQIIVDAADAKVQLVLDSVSITSEDSAPIYVKDADKVFVTLADGSNNTLSTTDEYTPDGDINVDGTIFAKSNLTINGIGALSLNSTNHGIVSKDNLRITGGILSIIAEGHGLSANDSVRIASSDSVTITAKKDGIHVSGNEDDEEKGYLYIYDCNLTITAESDALDAAYICQIDGGSFVINAGDDGIHAENNLYINEGDITIESCYEGLEGSCVIINNGDISINSSDDGINAAGGSTSQETDMKPENSMTQKPNASANDNMPQAPDSDSSNPDRKKDFKNRQDGGTRGNNSTDDNAPEGNMPNGDSFNGGMPGGGIPGGGMMDGDDSYVIIINGGNLYINANGDGLDSNGLLYINGGTVVVDGPSNGGNAALDWGTRGYINGGSVIAIGYSSMAEQFSEDSTACAILQTLTSSGSAGDVITLSDSEGKELLNHTTIKDYNCIQVCCPKVTVGGSYTLTAGVESFVIQLDTALYGSGAGMGGPMKESR